MLTINNTIDGAIQDIEIKGNTVQDPDNLSDIKSVGELQEDGIYKMSILSCGKNLFDGELEQGLITDSTGVTGNSDNYVRTKNYITVNNSYITLSCKYNIDKIYEYDNNKNFIQIQGIYTASKTVTLSDNTQYIKVRFHNPLGVIPSEVVNLQ